VPPSQPEISVSEIGVLFGGCAARPPPPGGPHPSAPKLRDGRPVCNICLGRRPPAKPGEINAWRRSPNAPSPLPPRLVGPPPNDLTASPGKSTPPISLVSRAHGCRPPSPSASPAEQLPQRPRMPRQMAGAKNVVRRSQRQARKATLPKKRKKKRHLHPRAPSPIKLAGSPSPSSRCDPRPSTPSPLIARPLPALAAAGPRKESRRAPFPASSAGFHNRGFRQCSQTATGRASASDP